MKWFLQLVFFLAVTPLLSAQSFDIKGSDSEIRVLLYRDGFAAAMAHNHVIVSQSASGTVQLDSSNIGASSVNVSIPVASLIVDNMTHRKEEGGDFASEIGEGHQADIKEKMLSDEVLDAKKYSTVTIQSKSVSGSLPNLTVMADVTIHGVTKAMALPVSVSVNGNQLMAEGSISLKQSDFGITPISLFFGGIKVKDEFTVKFKFKAQ